MYPLIVITGPTATGKTDVACCLAERISADILSCDSMMVYKEPTIITNKPHVAQHEQIVHYGLDVVSVTQRYDVYKYCQYARKIIDYHMNADKPLIICGGTGLYLRGILDGIFEGGPRNDELRELLLQEADTCGINALYTRLCKVDPVAAARIAANDLRRIVRALEVYEAEGAPISVKQTQRKGIWGKYPVKIFIIGMERERLYDRINRRVDDMFKRGAVREVESLLRLPLSITAQKIIGVKEIKGAIDGAYSFDEAREKMAQNTRHYAKRQITWFKKETRGLCIEARTPESVCSVIARNINAH